MESIPQHLKYKGNVTLGLPLGEAWKELLSMATEQVDVASFYWTLTGEDINVNSSSDEPVSCSAEPQPRVDEQRERGRVVALTLSVSRAGEGDPERPGGASLQERVCPTGNQRSQREDELHRPQRFKTQRFGWEFKFLFPSTFTPNI